MPDPADAPPADVTAELTRLTGVLDRQLPAKSATNLLIATWNVRGFDRFDPKWRSRAGDSPIRDRSNVAAIAEIVRRFDVVAVQEVRRSAQAFLQMLRHLGRDWTFLVTDVTDGRAGNSERLAFVYDATRVQPSGLACELVVAPRAAADGPVAGALEGQFARTPYAASFARGTTRVTLVTLHILYGKAPADRIPELTALAQWLQRWSAGRDPWGENLLALGDFNIDRRGDPLYEAFTSTGLEPPAGLNHIPRTIFDDPDAPPDNHSFYDQIAWFTRGRAKLSLPFVNAGTFDFTAGDLIAADHQRQLSYRISDHFPLWCEFGTT
jgi:endonuclease/exonuclease/phosphatase family metal-dependent hydrolase